MIELGAKTKLLMVIESEEPPPPPDVELVAARLEPVDGLALPPDEQAAKASAIPMSATGTRCLI